MTIQSRTCTLLALSALLTTNALSIDIPKKVQQKILAAAPEIDLNGDGQITVEELKAGNDKLPEDIRAVLDLYLDTQGKPAKASEPAKHKTTLPKPPARNGATPFIDPMFEYKETENITYGTAKSGDTNMPLLLDVYRPLATEKLPKKLPAMIFSFGGGWRKGSKDIKYIRDLCEYFATRGYVAISIQYRIQKDNPPALAGPAPTPEKNEQFRLMNAAFQDTCNAVRWVRTNAGKYNIDPNRIGIGGVSAGAFNALNTAFCDDKLTGPDAEVAAVISLMGAIGASHIDKDDPPAFIAHGTSDNVAPYAMVKNMVQQLEKVKAAYSFYPVEGVAHRLETILETKFDGKTVKEHSLDFCFEAMKLGEVAITGSNELGCLTALGKPNIVLLYIDDWAWNGSPVAMDDHMPNSRMPVLRMPNVDRLAREGMKFRNAYASPQCSPARVCVQTGQSSPRSGFTVFMNDFGQDYYNEKQCKGFPVVDCVSDMEIDPGAMTIPEALKPLGYVCAHIGKWHMRGDPGTEGYSVHDGDTSNTPGNTVADEGKKRIPADMTDPKLMFSVTEKAMRFMDAQVKAKTPFYLQISHYAMHEGRECLPKTREKYVNDPAVQAWYKEHNKTAETVNRKDDPAVWLGMGEDLDGRIGAVLEKIRELGIEENTYVVMVSDNGYRHAFLPGSKQPHHGHKWWLWQGGIRVPMIVKGPGIKPGSVFTGNVVNYDFLPTFVDWADGDPKSLKDIDGVSLAAYMAGRQPDMAFLTRNLYFHYPHYRSSMPHSAMVSGTYKVLHFYESPDIPMLFNLSESDGEVSNIAREHPQKHERLYTTMMTYLKDVGARMPKTNPDYAPDVYKKQKEYAERMRLGAFKGKRPLADDERL